jgi:small membrane protein
MTFQVLLILFAVFALVRTYRQYKAETISRYWLFLWFVLWVIVIGTALWPQTTDLIAQTVGVGRGADLLLYIAVVVLAYLEYRSMMRQERLHRELTALVRKVAIDRAHKPKND